MLKPINRKSKIIIGLNIFVFTLFSFIGLGFCGTLTTHATSSLDTTVQLDVNSVINISAPTTATLSCDGGSSTITCNTTTNIAVNTNNVTGYTLQMNATNGYSNALTNTTINPNPTIPTLSSASSIANPSSFPLNTWGYTGGSDQSSVSGGYNCTNDSTNGNYCPILDYIDSSSGGGNSSSGSSAPAYAPNHIIKVTDTPTVSSTVPITYQAKASNVKEAGTYSTSVTYTAIANAVPIVTMQEFDSTACANATTNVTFTLRDARDGTDYTVSKLRDGNCWMTQNLELGKYGESMTLTNELSNVSPEGYVLTFEFENNSVFKRNPNHFGNFYNWSQTTANSGTDTSGQNASYSICAKGWRLPINGSGAFSSDNEFYAILHEYISTGTWNGYYWENITNFAFTNTPLSMVNAGSLNSDGTYGYQSYGGYNSSTSAGLTKAWGMYYNTWGNVNTMAADVKSMYRSIRCIVSNS